MEHTTLVHENAETPSSRSNHYSSNTTNFVLSNGAGKNPSIEENETLCMQIIRQTLQQRGIPQEPSEIIILSW